MTIDQGWGNYPSQPSKGGYTTGQTWPAGANPEEVEHILALVKEGKWDPETRKEVVNDTRDDRSAR